MSDSGFVLILSQMLFTLTVGKMADYHIMATVQTLVGIYGMTKVSQKQIVWLVIGFPLDRDWDVPNEWH